MKELSLNVMNTPIPIPDTNKRAIMALNCLLGLIFNKRLLMKPEHGRQMITYDRYRIPQIEAPLIEPPNLFRQKNKQFYIDFCGQFC